MKTTEGKQTFNINVNATVKLTDAGKKIFFNHLKQFGYTIKFPGYDEETNTLTTELWQIMQIFGKNFFLGGEIPFVKNEISLNSDTLA